MITNFEKVFLILALLLIIFVGYGTIEAAPEPKKIEQKEEKSHYFCDGLSLPKERQCPTMADL